MVAERLFVVLAYESPKSELVVEKPSSPSEFRLTSSVTVCSVFWPDPCPGTLFEIFYLEPDTEEREPVFTFLEARFLPQFV